MRTLACIPNLKCSSLIRKESKKWQHLNNDRWYHGNLNEMCSSNKHSSHISYGHAIPILLCSLMMNIQSTYITKSIIIVLIRHIMTNSIFLHSALCHCWSIYTNLTHSISTDELRQINNRSRVKWQFNWKKLTLLRLVLFCLKHSFCMAAYCKCLQKLSKDLSIG